MESLPTYALNGENVDVTEDIIVDWSLRFPRSATTTSTFLSVWTLLLCIAVSRYECSGVHMLYNCQFSRGRPPLFYDHTNVILKVVIKERVLLYVLLVLIKLEGCVYVSLFEHCVL